MPDDALSVTGGVGGITADYEDMITHARALEALGAAVTERLPGVAAVSAAADLLASAVLSPGTAARVEAQVAVATGGPHGLAVTAARLTATAVTLRAAVTAYQAVDAAQAELVGWAQATAAIPALLAPLAATGGLVAVEVQAGQLWLVPRTLRFGGAAFTDNLYANPWIVDGLVKDGPALLWAAGGAVNLGLGPFGAPALTGLNAWTTGSEGAPFPPLGLEQASADVIALGRLFGRFGPQLAHATPQSGPGAPPPEMATPDSVRNLVQGIGSLGREPGTVRIFAVVGADGERRWVVELPGTQVASTVAGENPVDMTNNVRLMAGQDAAQNVAVREAMRLAGIAPGEEVMLAGHSQGGITAASLASDPLTRAEFRITQVVTAGAPIARFDIPDDVAVLAIEHTRDAVPRLDGEPNPDRPNWVTVHRDAAGMDVDGELVDDMGASHRASAYAQTGGLVDVAQDPSLAAARAGLEPFLGGDVARTTYQDFDMRRDLP